MGLENPCIQCGACCAFFRVSFYWEETTAADPNGVPTQTTEELDEFLQCMRGTNQPHPRCQMLTGKIGEKVACAIYARRSSTCREFGLHIEKAQLQIDSEGLQRCNEARQAWNLPPLTRAELHFLTHYPPVRLSPEPQHFTHHSKLSG
jgi:Predicted Fe-S-cluster oxidoreductase